MLDALVEGFTSVMTCVSDFANALFGTSGSLNTLLPAVGLALGYGAVKFGIHVVKSIVPNI